MGLGLIVRMVRSRAAVSAEILFLRKQLAFYQEHEIQPNRLTDAARVGLVFWSQWFDSRAAPTGNAYRVASVVSTYCLAF